MFDYHQPNLDSMKQYLSENESSNRGDGPRWWSIPKGMSSVRILPPWDPTGRVALPVYMHPIEFKGEGMSYTKYNWTCVGKTFNKPCAICDGLSKLSAAGVDISNWEANRRQFYLNAIVMHDPTYNAQRNEGTAPGTHVLMKAPKTFYDWLIAQITNQMIGDITSVTNGIDVYITKEGSGLGTTYSMTLSPEGRTGIPQEYLDKITDLYNLDDIFSAGFDQKQVDELVAHLGRSSGVMNNVVNNTMQQMGGYQPQPTQPYVSPQSTGYPPLNNPVTSISTQFQQAGQMPPVGASPFSQPPQPPQIPQAPQAAEIPPWESAPAVTAAPEPVAPLNQSSPEDKPKCFGNYDAGTVNCVVCPVEVDCSRSK